MRDHSASIQNNEWNKNVTMTNILQRFKRDDILPEMLLYVLKCQQKYDSSSCCSTETDQTEHKLNI